MAIDGMDASLVAKESEEEDLQEPAMAGWGMEVERRRRRVASGFAGVCGGLGFVCALG